MSYRCVQIQTSQNCEFKNILKTLPNILKIFLLISKYDVPSKNKFLGFLQKKVAVIGTIRY